MALSTSQLRSAWGPACSGTKVSLAEAYDQLNQCMLRWNYAPRSGVTGAMNCRKITGGTGYSLHAFGPGGYFTFWSNVRVTMALACDINWDKNPYTYNGRVVTDMPAGMVNEIKALRTGNNKQVWGWGGDYGGKNKDAMHYEIVCTPADLATGIRTGAGKPVSPPPGEPDWAALRKYMQDNRNAMGNMGTLRQGQANLIEVGVLQACLNIVSGRGLKVDGDWGPATMAAVKDFQALFGLAQDGVVGDATRFYLCVAIDKILNG